MITFDLKNHLNNTKIAWPDLRVTKEFFKAAVARNSICIQTGVDADIYTG